MEHQDIINDLQQLLVKLDKAKQEEWLEMDLWKMAELVSLISGMTDSMCIQHLNSRAACRRAP